MQAHSAKIAEKWNQGKKKTKLFFAPFFDYVRSGITETEILIKKSDISKNTSRHQFTYGVPHDKKKNPIKSSAEVGNAN